MDSVLRLSRPNCRKGTRLLYKRLDSADEPKVQLSKEITPEMLEYAINYIEFRYEPIRSKLIKLTIVLGVTIAKIIPGWKDFILPRKEPSHFHRFMPEGVHKTINWCTAQWNILHVEQCAT